MLVLFLMPLVHSAVLQGPWALTWPVGLWGDKAKPSPRQARLTSMKTSLLRHAFWKLLGLGPLGLGLAGMAKPPKQRHAMLSLAVAAGSGIGFKG